MPRLPLLLALLFSFTLFAGEVPVGDLTIIPGSTEYGRFRPVVAGGDDGFLVYWTETHPVYGETGSLGRAYDADGNPLQTWASISLGFTPQVVWTGEEYLVVAATYAGRFGFRFTPAPAISVQRLRRDGSTIAQNFFLPAQSQARVLSLAWNGTHALALVSVDGPRLLTFDGEGNLVSDAPADADIVAVAPKGDSFLLLRGARTLAIAEGGGRYAAVREDAIVILDADGREVERVAIAGARTVVWDGAAWLTASVSDGAVCSVKFTGASDVQRDCRLIADAVNPAIGVIPRRTLLAWEGASRQIVTDSGIASMTHVWQHARASAVDATGFLLVWFERALRIGGFAGDGTARDEFEIATEFPSEVDVAVNGDRTLLVWRTSSAIELMRLDANGRPIEPRGSLPWGTAMRVASLGDGWLIARENENAIVATRVSRAGVVLGEQTVLHDVLMNASPAAATTPLGALVASQRDDSNEFVLQPLDVHGAPLGSPVVLPGQSPMLACGPQACIASVFRIDRLAVMLLSHDGRALTELVPLERRDNLDRMEVTAQADGTFRIYLRDVYNVIAADGTPRGWMPSGAFITEWGGVEEFRGRTWFFYSRGGRAFARDLPPRMRAVRH